MLEFLICSTLTILPDFLYRRYGQGKRIGHEITLYSVWFELRWGITACAILTLSLITMIFFFHPSSGNVTSFFRTVTILPVTSGRVEEVLVRNNQRIAAGDVIFRLDDDRQRSALETARSQLDQIEAQVLLAQADLATATAQVAQVAAQRDETQRELARTEELMARGSSAVSEQELDRQRARAASAQAAVEAAEAQEAAARARVTTLLPAQRATAQAALAQAQVELDLMTVRAGVDGTVEQFVLQPGDFVSSVLRPAGIIVPEGSGTARIEAGYGQISAQVIRVGMVGEISCASVPLTIIPVVVTQIQDVIAAGQLRPTDQLVDVSRRGAPGTITVYMEPLYEGGLDRVIPGSSCMSNLYTSNHDRLQDPDLGGVQRLGLHVIDAVGLVHAFMLRIQTLLLPMQTLVLSGGH